MSKSKCRHGVAVGNCRHCLPQAIARHLVTWFIFAAFIVGTGLLVEVFGLFLGVTCPLVVFSVGYLTEVLSDGQ